SRTSRGSERCSGASKWQARMPGSQEPPPRWRTPCSRHEGREVQASSLHFPRIPLEGPPRMSETLKPATPEQLQEAVAWALAAKLPLDILGQGSKRGWGRPVQAAATLDMSGLRGITLYEPEELVLSARAGTPLAEIRAALAERNQQLAFEPGDWA